MSVTSCDRSGAIQFTGFKWATSRTVNILIDFVKTCTPTISRSKLDYAVSTSQKRPLRCKKSTASIWASVNGRTTELQVFSKSSLGPYREYIVVSLPLCKRKA
ncbi:hypothetical protein A0H81_07211 [Grifola frondosa]|uniref:Uncharacterized protein n=1 Tax=Grifola frondosa TaxID=5627 RepID=A0A1C7M961_GRIFR|nr:hypothetical protein A0H81_07211 [Grifola frondosa]